MRTYARAKDKGDLKMCAPSRPSAPPAPPPAPTPAPVEAKDTSVRRTGKTLRSGSPSQRGRGVLIRSRNPLGIDTANQPNLGTRQSLLTPIQNVPVSLTIGGY